jgi:hypothetical protein
LQRALFLGLAPICGHNSFMAGPQSRTIVFLVVCDKQG